jgi:hypothetical protein
MAFFVKYVAAHRDEPWRAHAQRLPRAAGPGADRGRRQEIAGAAAHAVMNTIFTTVANTALREE